MLLSNQIHHVSDVIQEKLKNYETKQRDFRKLKVTSVCLFSDKISVIMSKVYYFFEYLLHLTWGSYIIYLGTTTALTTLQTLYCCTVSIDWSRVILFTRFDEQLFLFNTSEFNMSGGFEIILSFMICAHDLITLKSHI